MKLVFFTGIAEEYIHWDKAVILIVAISVVRRSRDHNSKFNLDDLLLGDDGLASKAAAVMYVALLSSTWVIVWETVTEKLSDTIFSAYLLAWVAPTVTKLITGRTPSPTPPPP